MQSIVIELEVVENWSGNASATSGLKSEDEHLGREHHYPEHYIKRLKVRPCPTVNIEGRD